MHLLKSSRFIPFFLSAIFANHVHAENANNVQHDSAPQEDDFMTKPPVQLAKEEALKEQLPSESKQADQQGVTKKESIDYFKKHPEKLEPLLLELIRQVNSESLALLLPIYATYDKRDDSLIDWGNAIIAQQKGDYTQAISLYRKINAALPKIRLLRFYMATALYKDKQFAAAESEFLKLRSDSVSEADKKVLNQYLEMIRKQNTWSFSANFGYLHDTNITNSPKVGTKLGQLWTFTSKHEEGTGFSYNVDAEKKWHLPSRYYLSVTPGLYGKYYWDNKKYNDMTASIRLGVGYQDASKDIVIAPEFSERRYAGGSSATTSSLKEYNKTVGLNIIQNYWLRPNLRFQNHTRATETNYVAEYGKNDSINLSTSNAFIYTPSHIQYYYAGIDLARKKAKQASESFKQNGIRLGWGRAWSYGMSSNLNVGYSKRNYQGVDLFNIKRENKYYNTSLSLWNRGIHLYGLTPRLNLSYVTVKSNESFEEYSKSNATIEFTKTF